MTTTDVEMSTDEKKSGIVMLRKKLKEWSFHPYLYRIFNKDESPNWRRPRFDDDTANRSLNAFYSVCKKYQSFDFSFDQPMIVGKGKHCNYSELDEITNFNNPQVIQKTINGRLFRGTIVEGSKERPAIDEVELFTVEKLNMHPNLVKLYCYYCDTRLALVFDEEFTQVMLSDVLLSDDFGWDKRMKVATQLADLFSFLHENNVALGCVTRACIMIDKEVNIKVFDFGYVTNSLGVDLAIIDHAVAPEIVEVEKTAKSDVYMFGVLLVELISKRKVSFIEGRDQPIRSIEDAVKCGKSLVHEFFKEVDQPTALRISLLAISCVDFDPDKRPAMKDVLHSLNAMGMRGEKRKRDENEAEQTLGLAASEF